MRSSDPLPTEGPPARPRATLAIAVAIVLTALAIAWTVTPLAHVFDRHQLAAWGQQVRDWPFAPLVVIAAFVASGLVATPGTVMMGATALVFGAWPGSLYSFAGMMVSGVVVYAIGRYAARDMVDDWLSRRAGSRLDALHRLLARRGFLTVTLIRLTPIPFSIQNVVIGASRVGFVDYLCGTAIGILPVLTLMAGVATQFEAWITNPGWNQLAALIATALGVVAIGWSLRRWAMRRYAASTGPNPQDQ